MKTNELLIDDRDTCIGLRVLVMVYLAITVHMVVVALRGGLSGVSFAIFGACQYAPGLLAVLIVPAWRSRLGKLLAGCPGARWLIGGYLAAVLALGLCVLVPYLTGYRAMTFGDGIWNTHPLVGLVPGFLQSTPAYLPFVLLIAPIMHLVNAAGEEIFWRGFLLDWLESYLPRRAAWLSNGVLWGLWHAPMIVLLGWDFPGHPIGGIVSIIVSQVFWSVVLCWVTRKTESLWPAIVMHATANALTIGLYDRLIDHDFNLLFSPWGLLGGAIMAVAALPILLSRQSRFRLEGGKV